MSFALYRKSIHCPNCHYEGSAKLAGNGAGMWVAFLILLMVAFFVPLLWIAAGLMILIMLLRPAKQLCPKCLHPHPVPIDHWRAQNPANPPDSGA